MISERLKTVAEMIEKNKVVFDVGSDHALLPCFLVQNNITNKVYAGDIGEGPLKMAKQSIKKFSLDDKITPVLSDGLSNASDDVEVVTICGMGYFTIEHILDNCDVNKYECFIVQSNKDVNLLRKYISEHNYTILDEKVVYDDFYYQVIKFSSEYHENYSDLQIKYGPVLLENKDEVFIDYLIHLRDKLVKINETAKKDEYVFTIKEIEALI